MGFIIYRLRPVLHNGKPPGSGLASCREKHFCMFFQPVHILSSIDHFQIFWFMLYNPGKKIRVFQIANTNHAICNACPSAYFSKYQAVFSTWPGISSLFPDCMQANLLYRIFCQLIQFCFGYEFLYSADCCRPIFIFYRLFFPEYILYSALPSFCLSRPPQRRWKGLWAGSQSFYMLSN